MHNYKPKFHITGEKGWINDPNGIIYFKGLYHVFFQYHPYSCEWGPMHWGHVISRDLVHWTYQPIALTPGDEFDKDGCFSGTSLVVNDTLYIVYTGFINNNNPDDIKQIQCLASSQDGIHFKKHGVIIDGSQLPKEYKPCDFRDPKLIQKNGLFYLLVAAKRKEGGGSIVAFKSLDLFNWEFVNDVLPHKSEGGMIECVDYHNDLGIILYSEQDFPKDNDHCLNIHSCEYELGHLDESLKFVPNSPKTLIDYGFDFYAPQVTDEDHYLIGWMNMWGRNNPSTEYGFAGMLTVPRKITIENGKMRQKPVIFGELKGETTISGVYNNRLSVGTLELKVKDLEALSINLREGENEVTKFYLKNNEFFFDRSHSGKPITGLEEDELSKAGIRKMPYFKQEEDTIYIVMDKYSIELFVNGISMTNTVYPQENSDRFEINVKARETELSIYK